MLPNGQSKTGCQKLEPQVKLPTPAVLRELSAQDQKLLRQVLEETAEYIGHELFERDGAEAYFVRPIPPLAKPGRRSRKSANDDSGIYGLPAPDEPLNKDEREQFLFMRFNYCRGRLFALLEQHAGVRLSGEATREVLYWHRLVLETRGEIVRENVPLVLAMAKRTRVVGLDLTDLISEGNLALMRAVAKFDCARGYKFSTYACRAILKSFSRLASRAARRRGHIPTEFDPELEKSDYLEQRRVAHEEYCIDELKTIMEENTADLSDVEQRVIHARFALHSADREAAARAQTLEQVGEMIGVTKERVRQIQNKALSKLRSALESGALAR